MRPFMLSVFGIFALVAATLWSAQSKLHDFSRLALLKVGMPLEQLSFLGDPLSITKNERIYLMPDQSTLVLSVSDGAVSGGWLKLKQPLKINDPQFQGLRFVQMGMDAALRPTWFYAGAANSGRVFKVSSQGYVESMTWVKPFSADQKARQLQALLRDFTHQRLPSL